MDTFIRIAALCVIGAVLALILKKGRPEFSFCIGAVCCVLAFAAAAELLSPVLSFARELQAMTGLSDALLAPLLKTVGIGLLAQLAGSFCQDAGQQSLAKTVELCGTVLALYASLPLARAVLQTVKTLMGG